MPLRIAPGVEVPEGEVDAEYSRASGPGGQHVNKTESRVTLRFPLATSPSIPAEDRARMVAKLGPRLTKSGEVLVSSEGHRDRAQNESEAFERLEALLREAYTVPKPRRPTRPTRGSKERRLEAKRRTGGRKRDRQSPGREE